MSVRTMAAVFDLVGLEPTQKLVLLALADHADNSGENAWPAIDTLAVKVGVSARSVQRHLRQLEEAGLIRCDARGGGRSRPATYSVLPENGDTGVGDNRTETVTAVSGLPAPETPTSVSGLADSETVTPVTETVTPVTETVTPVSQKGDMGVTRTILNHQEPSGTYCGDAATDATTEVALATTETAPDTEPRRARARDPIWDALVACCGPVTNDTERGSYNHAHKQLRQTMLSERIPSEQQYAAVLQLHAAHLRSWPDIVPTPHSLAKHAGKLIRLIRNGDPRTGQRGQDRATDQIAELEQLRRQLEADEHQHPPAGAAL